MGRGEIPLRSHLFHRYTGSYGGPRECCATLQAPGRGKGRLSLLMARGGGVAGSRGCPWRTVGGGGVSPAPQAVTGPGGLGSVWKTVLREQDGGMLYWVQSRWARPHTPMKDSLA